jgi:hypothetical protein
VLEEYGLRKGDFDKAERLITACRKYGDLPLDIVAVDDTRETVGLQTVDTGDPTTYARRVLAAAYEMASARYTPSSFWTTQSTYVEVLVEKLDLVNLFRPVCAAYFVPLTPIRGWADVHSRAKLMGRMRTWAEQGKTLALLLCVDHDPGDLHIAEKLAANLAELRDAVAWDPTGIEIVRFGLTAAFIRRHRLTWIDGLETASGERLGEAPDGAEARRVDADRDPMAEVNLLFGLVDHEGLQHRDLVEERLDVLKDHAGLLPVRGEHHHHAPFARSQDGAVVAEAGDEDGNQRRDARVVGRHEAAPDQEEPVGTVDLDAPDVGRGRGRHAADEPIPSAGSSRLPRGLPREQEDRTVRPEADPEARATVLPVEPGPARGAGGFPPQAAHEVEDASANVAAVVLNSSFPSGEQCPSVSMRPWRSASRCSTEAVRYSGRMRRWPSSPATWRSMRNPPIRYRIPPDRSGQTG